MLAIRKHDVKWSLGGNIFLARHALMLWAWHLSVCSIGGLWSCIATKSGNQHMMG